MSKWWPLIAGVVAAPLAAICVFGGSPAGFFLCPQALSVLFVRGWWHAPTTIFEADWPEFIMASAWWPVTGLVLSRIPPGKARQALIKKLSLWHIGAIGLAFLTRGILRWLWYY